MSPIILAFYALGLAGVGLGLAALWLNWRSIPPGVGEGGWRSARAASFALGLVLGGVSVPLTLHLRYPIETADGHGQVAGIPFFVSYTDRLGHDFLSVLSLADVVANGAFWFLLPQLALWVWAARRRALASPRP